MKKNVLLLAGIIFLMASCYPDEPISYSDYDLVYTNYTAGFNFASKGTYAMPDKIVKVTGNLAEGQNPGQKLTTLLMQTCHCFLQSGPIPRFITGMITGAGIITTTAAGDIIIRPSLHILQALWS